MATTSHADFKWQIKAVSLLTLCCLSLVACQRKRLTPPQQSEVWEKLRFSLEQCNSQGLTKDGTSLDYEFCIPNSEQHKAEVLKADASIRLQKGSGRVGCKDGELLCIGNTRGKDYRMRLYRICQLPYVSRVEQTFWE